MKGCGRRGSPCNDLPEALYTTRRRAAGGTVGGGRQRREGGAAASMAVEEAVQLKNKGVRLCASRQVKGQTRPWRRLLGKRGVAICTRMPSPDSLPSPRKLPTAPLLFCVTRPVHASSIHPSTHPASICRPAVHPPIHHSPRRVLCSRCASFPRPPRATTWRRPACCSTTAPLASPSTPQFPGSGRRRSPIRA